MKVHFVCLPDSEFVCDFMFTSLQLHELPSGVRKPTGLNQTAPCTPMHHASAWALWAVSERGRAASKIQSLALSKTYMRLQNVTGS